MWFTQALWVGFPWQFLSCAVNTNANSRLCRKISCTEAVFACQLSECCFIFLSPCPDVLALWTKTNLKLLKWSSHINNTLTLPRKTSLTPSIYTNLLLVIENEGMNGSPLDTASGNRQLLHWSTRYKERNTEGISKDSLTFVLNAMICFSWLDSIWPWLPYWRRGTRLERK